MVERLLPPREACRRLGISFITLKRWIYSGKIGAVKTPTGRWMIPESEVERIISSKIRVREARAIVYARVSSGGQKSDLGRQIQYLTRLCSAKGCRVTGILSYVASGLGSNRRGLLRLFDCVVNRHVDVVIVTKDRLTRFGFEYLEYFFKRYGVRIGVINGDEQEDSYQELVEDLTAIVTSFAGKLYGMRSCKKEG